MDSFEFNKFAGAVIATILFIIAATSLADNVFHVEAVHETAYALAEPEAVAAGPVAVVDAGPSLADLLVSESADRGAKVFAKCKACHTVGEGDSHRTGPNLFGIMGRDVGSSAGYKYSSALKEAPGAWDFAAMDAYLTNPRKTIPGNKMSFAGLKKPVDRARVILFLRGFANDPMPLPAVAAVEVVTEDATEEAGDAVEEAVDAAPSDDAGGDGTAEPEAEEPTAADDDAVAPEGEESGAEESAAEEPAAAAGGVAEE